MATGEVVVNEGGGMAMPPLYKGARKGAPVRWTIGVEPREGGPHIVTRWGRVGGEAQETAELVASGKNAGRGNATSPLEQAETEARARWTKKKKGGYVDTASAAEAGEVDQSFVAGGIRPMLAETYTESKAGIRFPAKAQRKFDGHYCTAIIEEGQATLWSRSRKPIRSVPHIAEAASLAWGHLPNGTKVGGELYSHKFKEAFQDLSGLLRRDEPVPGGEVVEFHAYDAPGHPGGFATRASFLQSIFEADVPACLVLAETVDVANETELLAFYDESLEQGYEGAMVRNLEGEYHFSTSDNDRSLNVQKLKLFEDHEYLVRDVREGKGRMAGKAVFVLVRRLEDGSEVEFSAKMKGKLETLKHYWQHPEECIGRLLTVRHQGYYRSGKPRIPVGAEGGLRMRVDL